MVAAPFGTFTCNFTSYGFGRRNAVTPAQHASRKGWAVRAANFGRNPFTGDAGAAEWRTTSGRTMSLRRVALATATVFRNAIRAVADPCSEQLLFAIFQGEARSLLDLDDRPAAYDDVGRATPPMPPWLSSVSRGEYESLFVNLAQGRRLRIGEEVLTPLKGHRGVTICPPSPVPCPLPLARVTHNARTGPALLRER